MDIMMPKTFCMAGRFFALGLFLLNAPWGMAAEPVQNQESAIIHGQYMVMFEDEPALMAHEDAFERTYAFSARAKLATAPPIRDYAARLAAQQDDFETRARQLDPNFKPLRKFTHLVNAQAVQMDPAALAQIRQLPGVKSVAPMRRYYPRLTNSNDLMNAPLAWNSLGGASEAGEGVFIAIIDTGIDVTHPAFEADGLRFPEGFPKGDPTYTTGKVIAAYSFTDPEQVGGDPTPNDSDGHGTHVASNAGAVVTQSPLGEISGVAPAVYLGNYKVFVTSSASDFQLVSAIEQAVLDGADIINLSLGSELFVDSQLDPQLVAIQNAIDLGVMVVTAGGNAGDELALGTPAQLPEALTVGAVSNSHRPAGGQPEVRDKDLLVDVWVDGELAAEDFPATFATDGGPYELPFLGRYPIVDADRIDGGSFGSPDDGLVCESLSSDEPVNAWVLVQRGICTFVDKARRIQNIGGRGMLIYDEPDDGSGRVQIPPISPAMSGSTLPAMLTVRDAGLLIKDALQAGSEVEIAITGEELQSRSDTPNQMANFSTHGPGPHYNLKPDAVTVGFNSFGAIQNNVDANQFVAGGFDWLSGTSFSAPRAAGAAALVIQRHPDWPPSWVKSALVNNANPNVTKANSSSQADVIEMGNGRIDVAAALKADTVMVPSAISGGAFAPSEPVVETRWLQVINAGETESAYSFSLANPSAYLLPSASPNNFTLGAGEDRAIAIQLPITPDMPNGDLQQTFILSNQTTGLDYRIPVWARKFDTPEVTGRVLLVDNDSLQADSANSFEDFYIDRLNELGIAYDHWDVFARNETYPTASFMQNYDAVIWFMSNSSLNAIANLFQQEFSVKYNKRFLFENELIRYLDRGGSLFLSGMDYFDSHRDVAFSTEVLGVELDVHDFGANTIAGIDGNPVGQGIGAASVAPVQGISDFTDLVAPLNQGIARPAFFIDGNVNNTGGVTIEACNYRVVFLAFPLETLRPSTANPILEQSIDWLTKMDPSPAAIDSISPATVDVSQLQGQQTITISGQGFSFTDGYRARLDFTPLEDIKRVDCKTLVGKVAAPLEAGTYDLTLTLGDGEKRFLPNALQVIDQDTGVADWNTHP